MITASGRHVFPHTDEAPALSDIGRGLGRIVRWGGQTDNFLTVLVHTLIVCRLLDEEDQIHGLLHDAPEICCGDVPTTWKTKEALAYEEMILRRIYAEHDIPWFDEETHKRVRHADLRALVAEARVLGYADPEYLEKDVSLEPDEETLQLVSLHLDLVPELFHAPSAEAIFEEAFTVYRGPKEK